jgi:DNA-binding NtrC family response regulator
MPASILVATPHAAFGELLRISLEDSGQYQVRLVMSAKEAYAAAERSSYQMAILDGAICDSPFVQLCTDLLKTQKGLRLVIIPPDNNPSHASLGGLMPHGYLNRPFYLPDLLETISRLLEERQAEFTSLPASSPTLPLWLQEPLSMRAYLQNELSGTQAVAGILGMNGTTPGSGAGQYRLPLLEPGRKDRPDALCASCQRQAGLPDLCHPGQR